MLELDLDLEADLGVDTVKQAEMFAAVRETYGIARENLKLRDFPTLTHVVGFVRRTGRPTLPSSAVASPRDPPDAVARRPPLPEVPRAVRQARGRREDARGGCPCRSLRPALDRCMPTGVRWTRPRASSSWPTRAGWATRWSASSGSSGVAVLASPTRATPTDGVTSGWPAAARTVRSPGVFWLPALDVEPTGRRDGPRRLARGAAPSGSKLLYAAMRACRPTARTFLVVGHAHGRAARLDAGRGGNPLGGAVAGFTKAYKRERAEALVKAWTCAEPQDRGGGRGADGRDPA